MAMFSTVSVCWLVGLLRFPQNLDDGWVSVQNRTHKLLVWIDGTDTGYFFNTTMEIMILHLQGFVVPDLVNLNHEYTVMGVLKFRGIQDYWVWYWVRHDWMEGEPLVRVCALLSVIPVTKYCHFWLQKKGFKTVVHRAMSDVTVSDCWSVTISGMNIRRHPSTTTLVEHDTPRNTRNHRLLPHIRPNTGRCRSPLIRILLYIPGLTSERPL